LNNTEPKITSKLTKHIYKLIDSTRNHLVLENIDDNTLRIRVEKPQNLNPYKKYYIVTEDLTLMNSREQEQYSKNYKIENFFLKHMLYADYVYLHTVLEKPLGYYLSFNQDLNETFTQEHALIKQKFTQVLELYHNMKNYKSTLSFDLVSKRPDFTDIVNDLCSKYDISRQNTLYTIHLKDQKYCNIRDQINKYFENFRDIYYQIRK
jgi:hypothetical protein